MGILFDVDGVLTLPITDERKISVIDPELLQFLSDLHEKKIKFSLVTGRAYPWVKKFVINGNTFLNKIPIFMEYGLASFINNKMIISKKAKNFRDEVFFPILSTIKQISKEKGFLFEVTPYVDYPGHGSLWLEEKNVMISIVSNSSISLDQVHQIVSEAVDDYIDDIRLINHHLGSDILPKGWSKEQAAFAAYQMLDPDKKIEHWMVFGDNESDKEMCKPFTKVTYFDTKIGASETTKQHLKELNLI